MDMKIIGTDGREHPFTDLMRLEEVAEHLGVTRQTVMHWMDGKGLGSEVSLPHFRAFETEKKPDGIPLFIKWNVDQWLTRVDRGRSDHQSQRNLAKRKAARKKVTLFPYTTLFRSRKSVV